jgi:phage shock protein A
MGRAASTPSGCTVSRRAGWPGHGQLPWHSKPASRASRWLLARIGFWLALPGLDAAYQRHRLTLSRVRRAVATVATSRKRLELQVRQLELQVGQLEREIGELDDQSHAGMEAGHGAIAGKGQVSRGAIQPQLAELRRRYAAMQGEEERVSAACRYLQAKVEAFRAAKEAIEAAHTAADEAAQAAWAVVTGNARANAEGAGPGPAGRPN